MALPSSAKPSMPYAAFISYSHALDKPVAASLQACIQSLGKAWYQRRALRLFRDDTSLAATPGLWPAIERALAQSRFLIVLASPQFAASPWCNKEVAYWLEHRNAETVLVALTEGELSWQDGDFRWDAATPLPRCLKGRFANEPKWIDLRPFRAGAKRGDRSFAALAVDFAATLHGKPKEDLLSEEARQQKRSLRLAWSAVGGLALLFLIAGWQYVEAERERRQAVSNLAYTKFAVGRFAEMFIQFAGEADRAGRDENGLLPDEIRYLLDELSRRAPDDLQLRFTRTRVLLQQSMFHQRRAEFAGSSPLELAENNAAEAVALMRTLTTGPLRDRAIREVDGDVDQGLAEALGRLGAVQRARGNLSAALAAWVESRSLQLDLVQRDAVAGWNHERLIGIQRDLGSLFLDLDQHDPALAEFQDALARLDVLCKLGRAAKDDSGCVRTRDTLANVLDRLVLARRKAGDGSLALRLHELLLQLWQAADAVMAGNDAVQETLLVTLAQVGDSRADQGDKTGAGSAYSAALDMARDLESRSKGDMFARFRLLVLLEAVERHVSGSRGRQLMDEARAILLRFDRGAFEAAATPEQRAVLARLLSRLSGDAEAAPN